MPKDKRNPAKKGHNRVGGIDNEQLKSIIDRVENIEEQKAGLTSDIRDIYNVAKGVGFDVKAIRECIKQRRMDAEKREEQELILDTYRRAIGLIPEVDDVV